MTSVDLFSRLYCDDEDDDDNNNDDDDDDVSNIFQYDLLIRNSSFDACGFCFLLISWSA